MLFQDAKVANSHCLPREIAKLIFHRVNLKLLQRRKRAKERVKTDRLFHNNPLIKHVYLPGCSLRERPEKPKTFVCFPGKGFFVNVKPATGSFPQQDRA